MDRIFAKVLNVFAGGAIALNAGKNKGIVKKMKFNVLSGGRVIAQMKVTEVYDSFSIAEWYDNPVSDGQSKATVLVGQDLASE